MTLVLADSGGIEAKTHGWPVSEEMRRFVLLDGGGGSLEIEMGDFCSLVEYVLQNTNLEGDDDPRLGLVERIKRTGVIDGFLVISGGLKCRPGRKISFNPEKEDAVLGEMLK